MLLTVLSFLAKLAFIGFTALALRRSQDEREFYNDILERVEQNKLHDIPNVSNWTEKFPRVGIEGVFFLLVIIPAFFSWSFVAVLLYLAAVWYIYKNRTGRLFGTNDMFKLNIARIVFLILSFVSLFESNAK